MSFSQPSAGGDQFDAKDYNGRLLIVFPKSFSAETPTIHGVGPSADCDIILPEVIDQATGMPQLFTNARLFGNLAKSVSRDLGGQVLGRLGQVPTQRGNPAWVLQSFTEQDVALATPALNAYQAGQFKQPENPMAAPSPAPQPTWAPPAATAPPAQAGPPQWTPPPAAAPPAYQAPAQQATGAAPQWSPPAPAAQWQAPAPAAAPPASTPAAPPAGPPADPGLLAALAQSGISLDPATPHEEALAIYATIPK